MTVVEEVVGNAVVWRGAGCWDGGGSGRAVVENEAKLANDASS